MVLSFFFWNPFNHLPKDASPDEIYSEAGKVLAVRNANNRWTNSDREIWYLAGDAKRRGFYDLKYVTKRQVAKAMGDYIYSYIASQKKPSPPQGQGYRDAF